jgi:hypothetical protein
MPQQTDFHNWEYPVSGDTNYQNIFSRLFREIDRDTIIVDENSVVDTYEPKNDALFLANNTYELFIADGSSWNFVGTIGQGDGGDPVNFFDASGDGIIDPKSMTVEGQGATTADVVNDGDGTGTIVISSTDTNTDTDTHIDVEDDGAALASDIDVLNLGSNVTGTVNGSEVTVNANTTSTKSDEEIRREAYRHGPTATVETTSAKSASKTGGDPTYGETSISIPDGWTFELIEAGAWDESASGTSTAEILRAGEGNVSDTSTYTSVYSTLDTNKYPTDTNGNIDFTKTLYTFNNTTGDPVRFFFRAINSDDASSEYAVGGNWTFVRKAP